MGKWAIGALLGGVMLSPTMASAQPGPQVRRVELITMTASPGKDDGAAEAATDPALFREHDLSRRYVAFQMAQSFAETIAEPPRAPTIVPQVASTSAIVAPGWMRGGTAVQPLAFVPGCAPMPWRPSGFLDRTTETRRAAYYGMMSAIACEHGLPVGLFDAMILRESRYDTQAVSSKNAFGLTQLMPATAQGLGVDRYDPSQNLRGGARYLRQQLDRFGQVHLALAAYNAGPGRVRGGMVPAIAETRAYVTNILANWTRMSGGSQSQMRSAPTAIPATRARSAVTAF